MKRPDLAKWQYSDKLEGLLFFAQAFEEMLFDHTLDTYRVPALNSHFILMEFALALDDFESGELQAAALVPIAEELVSLLRACPVMKEILHPDLEWALRPFSRVQDHIAIAKDRVQHMLFVVSQRYWTVLKKLLLDLVPAGREKERILQLTRCLVCELINRGYSGTFLYFSAITFFFKAHTINDARALGQFLDGFDFKEKSFEVVLRGSRTFRLTKGFSEAAGVQVLDAPPNPKTLYARERAYLGEGKDDSVRFLRVSELKALDPHTAFAAASARAHLLISLAAYYIHRQQLDLGEQGLVYPDPGGDVQLLRMPKPPIHRRPDMPEEKLSQAVARIVKAISGNNLSINAKDALFRSIRLHAGAVQSDLRHVQFLNIWTVFETLCPKNPKKARINAFVDFMLPFLCVAYPAKVLRDLSHSLSTSYADSYVAILHRVPDGATRVEKLGAILSMAAHGNVADQLQGLCDRNPLLRNRLFVLRSALSSPKSIHQLITRHRNRVAQHLQRMYRVRNLIVHSGSAMPYLDTLVENVHSYCDRVMDMVITESEAHVDGQRQVEAIWEGVRDRHEEHLALLQKNADSAVDAANYLGFLFGPRPL